MCGCNNIHSLCCHHINPSEKSFQVFNKLDCRLSDLLLEAKKCKLLCHNCHISIHNKKATLRKNKLLNHIGHHECVRCGYSLNAAALNFHHIDNKDFQISSNQFNATREIPSEIIKELKKCELICTNCHTIEHSDVDFFNEHEMEIREKIQNYRETTSHDKSLVCSLFKDGLNVDEIVDNTNLPRNIVTSELSKHGLIDFGKIIDVDEIRKLHSEGYNSFDISKKMNKAQSSICRCLRRLGLTPNKRKHRNSKISITLDELEIKLKSKSLTEIAKEFNVSRYAMYKKLLRLRT